MKPWDSTCAMCEHDEKDHDFGAFACLMAGCECRRFDKGRMKGYDPGLARRAGRASNGARIAAEKRRER